MNPLSGVLGEAWKLYRAHAAHLLVIAFVIYLAAAVAAALLALAGGIFGALLGSIVEFFGIPSTGGAGQGGAGCARRPR